VESSWSDHGWSQLLSPDRRADLRPRPHHFDETQSRSCVSPAQQTRVQTSADACERTRSVRLIVPRIVSQELGCRFSTDTPNPGVSAEIPRSSGRNSESPAHPCGALVCVGSQRSCHGHDRPGIDRWCTSRCRWQGRAGSLGVIGALRCPAVSVGVWMPGVFRVDDLPNDWRVARSNRLHLYRLGVNVDVHLREGQPTSRQRPFTLNQPGRNATHRTSRGRRSYVIGELARRDETGFSLTRSGRRARRAPFWLSLAADRPPESIGVPPAPARGWSGSSCGYHGRLPSQR
jgi:hypothetical protein